MSLSRLSAALLCSAMLLCITSASAATVKQDWQLDGQEKGLSFTNSIERLATQRGFACRFDQLMEFSDGGGKHYSGDLAILKPGHFRWQYRKPYDQLYVGDGQVIWHYEPDLLQAERLTDLETINPVVMKLLDGRVPLADIRVVERSFDAERNIHRFKVQVTDAPQVWLGFSLQGNLVYIERQDLLGNRNMMHLSDCSYVAPAEKLFSFTPPDGVDVLDLRSTVSE
ncbi:MAG: LolA [Zetaproteobacteria bacterium CG12_big_fil_rev_8_21_14_0_65_54_13]|nr:MAG: LolA [Zetaproteobacteria bacterium CG12_big_fil_rev_8_21_14_0_65_54_13]PIX53927.1 MAG: LolA [Zetaproteobacteria bacterium CG_4_10_14_3_um_filter_54_28]PJA30096.1 MAG: LolA [Zetaproteobacteria bacterium CG_4_9_14_3_um_filter_54_145]